MYHRHEPEKTVLHGIVREHLETFLDRARASDGDGYPRFVAHEFRRYLDCGLLCHGFARLRCPQCGYERLVAFSCKGKLCPSCPARRTADTAARLVDGLLPQAGYRQWVLTFPWTLRFRLAADRPLLSTLMRVFLQNLFASQHPRGMERVAAKREADGSGYLDPDLAALCEAFFFSRNASVGTRENPMLPGLESKGEEGGSVRGKPLCASVEGFSSHAAQAVPAEDREVLERLLRYGLRAPFSLERLSRRPDGRVVYRMRCPLPNAQGATHLILEPRDFLRRLASLVSFPYSHQVRYHGVFANRSRFRGMLPLPPPSRHAQHAASPETGGLGDAGGVAGGGKGPTWMEPMPRRRVPWAQLLRRVLHLDALACPRCSTASQTMPMIVLAFLTDPGVMGKILRHLGLPYSAPVLSPARSPRPALGFALPDEDSISNGRDDDGGRDFVAVEPLIRPPP